MSLTARTAPRVLQALREKAIPGKMPGASTSTSLPRLMSILETYIVSKVAMLAHQREEETRTIVLMILITKAAFPLRGGTQAQGPAERGRPAKLKRLKME